jgi:hypothetical protein
MCAHSAVGNVVCFPSSFQTRVIYVRIYRLIPLTIGTVEHMVPIYNRDVSMRHDAGFVHVRGEKGAGEKNPIRIYTVTYSYDVLP